MCVFCGLAALGLAAQGVEDLAEQSLPLLNLEHFEFDEGGELVVHQGLDLVHQVSGDPFAIDRLGLDRDLDHAGAVGFPTCAEQVLTEAQARREDVTDIILRSSSTKASGIELSLHTQAHTFVDMTITFHGVNHVVMDGDVHEAGHETHQVLMIREVHHEGDELVEVQSHDVLHLDANCITAIFTDLDGHVLDGQAAGLGVGEVVEAAGQWDLGRVDLLEHHAPVHTFVDIGRGLGGHDHLAIFISLNTQAQL